MRIYNNSISNSKTNSISRLWRSKILKVKFRDLNMLHKVSLLIFLEFQTKNILGKNSMMSITMTFSMSSKQRKKKKRGRLLLWQIEKKFQGKLRWKSIKRDRITYLVFLLPLLLFLHIRTCFNSRISTRILKSRYKICNLLSLMVQLQLLNSLRINKTLNRLTDLLIGFLCLQSLQIGLMILKCKW